MTSVPQPEVPFQPDRDPFFGFQVTAEVDRSAYQAGQIVRVTVVVTNDSPRFAVHAYPGWRRFDLTVRDVNHRVVAHTVADRAPERGGFEDGWLPGQMAIFPVYWQQQEGPVVGAWSREAAGPRAAPGRYRARVTWLGSVPGTRGELADTWSSWFQLV